MSADPAPSSTSAISAIAALDEPVAGSWVASGPGSVAADAPTGMIPAAGTVLTVGSVETVVVGMVVVGMVVDESSGGGVTEVLSLDPPCR